MSFSRNLLNNSLPKLPGNILCQTVDLTKSSYKNNQNSMNKTESTISFLQIQKDKKNSSSKISRNNMSSRMIQSNYEKARNSRISD